MNQSHGTKHVESHQLGVVDLGSMSSPLGWRHRVQVPLEDGLGGESTS